MGVIIFHASFDSFAEQDQLVQLCNEKAAEAESMKRSFLTPMTGYERPTSRLHRVLLTSKRGSAPAT